MLRNWLVGLDTIEPGELGEVGGKASSLAFMARSGLPVPPGLVVRAQALEDHLAHWDLLAAASQGVDPTIGEAILNNSLLPELAAALRERTGRWGGLFAVRSSGAEEDGGTWSHAGLFETLLGIPPGDRMELAIRQCWASAWSARAGAYAGRKRGCPRMAVLIQQMVDPKAAGVLFTINPASGSWREMAVEAAWGLGDGVVAGELIPDSYRVRRPPPLPRGLQRAVARWGLHETSVEVFPQETEKRVGKLGLEERAVAASQVAQRKLSAEELLRLCRLGLRIEARLGGPADVEWAMTETGEFRLLQARPVTTARDVRPAGTVVWTRRFIGERWTEPATPLGWSLISGILEPFIAYPQVSRAHLGGEPPTRLFRHSPYVNATIFRHLAFKLPGMAPPRFLLELLPASEEKEWLRSMGRTPDLQVYAGILRDTLLERRWRRFRWNPFLNWRHWEEFRKELEAALVGLSAPILTRAEARERHLRCRAWASRYIGIHICSLLFANIWYEAARALLEGEGLDVGTLLCPDRESETVRTNQALRQLGRGEISLDLFLLQNGHRASSSWELFSPRWSEEPELALTLSTIAARSPDPAVEAARKRAEADEGMGGLGRPTREVVRLCRRYLSLREDQRFVFDRLLSAWKVSLRWLEKDTGLALRYLEAAEVEALLDGVLDPREAANLAERRESAYQDEKRRRQEGDEPPEFLNGDQLVALSGGARLEGLGISAGVARGTARVLRAPEEAASLRAGEILVARAADPGWTPIFPLAAGLVLETGGMLSHGAVVAREYRLPAVVNIADATRRIRNGQALTVDGRRGLVLLH
jgi:phosphohistidine swiveling domain-containing protein